MLLWLGPVGRLLARAAGSCAALFEHLSSAARSAGADGTVCLQYVQRRRAAGRVRRVPENHSGPTLWGIDALWFWPLAGSFVAHVRPRRVVLSTREASGDRSCFVAAARPPRPARDIAAAGPDTLSARLEEVHLAHVSAQRHVEIDALGFAVPLASVLRR